MPKKKYKRQASIEAVARAMEESEESERWAPFLKMLGLDKRSGDRLTRLLVLHLLLDRAITAWITCKLHETPSAFFEVEKTVATLPIGRRIDLLRAAGFISASCAKDVRAVNKARNDLAHYQPKLGFELSLVKEASSEAAYQQCLHKGIHALTEIAGLVADDLNARSKGSGLQRAPLFDGIEEGIG